jgi:hypothetical protein
MRKADSSGVVLIAACILVVLASGLLLALSQIADTGTTQFIYQTQSNEALYRATGALQEAKYYTAIDSCINNGN